MLASSRLAVLRVLLILAAAPGQDSLRSADVVVRQIAIQSRWGGLGKPSKTELLIRNENGVYRLDGSVIDSPSVDWFIRAVLESPIPKPSAVNLGLTKSWLEATSDDIVTNAKEREEQDSTYWAIGDGTATQKSLFKTSYTNPDFIAKVLPDLFRCCHTDDFPSASVTITYSDGNTIVVSSHSQSQYMLPWKIERNGNSSETFNKNISAALTRLLPQGATNRERIAGEDFDVALAGIVMKNIQGQWKLLRAEDRDRAAITRIRSAYALVSADVNPYHDVTFGVYSEKNGGEEENLHARVRNPKFPRNLTEEVILLYKEGKVRGVDQFLADGGRYERLVLSVAWLARRWGRYPKWPATLLWVHDSSFSDKAMQNFAADMRRLGKDRLADEVRSVQNDVAVLNISYGDWWLVLPDKRMVLWRYESVSGLLGFKQSQFSPKECADYQGVTGGCVGAVISQEGKVMR
jgi:hypothetical protein